MAAAVSGRAGRRSKPCPRGRAAGVHTLRHSFATHLLMRGVKLTGILISGDHPHTSSPMRGILSCWPADGKPRQNSGYDARAAIAATAPWCRTGATPTPLGFSLALFVAFCSINKRSFIPGRRRSRRHSAGGCRLRIIQPWTLANRHTLKRELKPGAPLAWVPPSGGFSPCSGKINDGVPSGTPRA